MRYPRESRVCQFLLRKRWISLDQLTEALEEQRRERELGFPTRSFEAFLAERGDLDPAKLLELADYAESTPTPQPGAPGLTTTERTDDEGPTVPEGIGARTEDETGHDEGFGSDISLRPGTRVGPVFVVGRIGRGGGGTVYLARWAPEDDDGSDTATGLGGPREDESTPKRPALVALKVFSGERSHRRARERFLREARVACLLRHHGIVAGLDAGVFEGGFYYAMEYVEGQSLRRAIDTAGRLDERRVLDYAIRLTLALDFIHGLGFVHRDVKPDNILLGYDGSVRLCDLGLARPIALKEGITTAGVALGTPRYISPEQARGADDVDARCDIYSLGITLFHALVGEPPFLGESGIVIMSRHLYEDVPDVRDRRPDCSRGLAEVIWKMTRRRREDRHVDAKELLDALLEVAAALPEPELV